MSASLGRISVRLVQPTREESPPDLVDLINANIKPPTPIEPSAVYIGAMYVVSDEVNSFGGRFPPEEHQQLAQLLVDSPVLTGHRKDRLPIGRNFHAAVAQRNNRSWVKSYFYWLKNTEGAEALRKNIDGGVYKECSIGFTFLFPECSVCGKDIRSCSHEPFRRYVTPTGDGNDTARCYFNYRQIERVLETSLVYRGALPDTSVTRQLTEGNPETEDSLSLATENPTRIARPEDLDKDKRYLLVPCYESIPVLLSVRNGTLCLRHRGGEPLDAGICARFATVGSSDMPVVYAHLVGYRGKERCRLDQVTRHLAGQSSSVTRLELKLFPPAGLAAPNDGDTRTRDRVRLIRHRITGVPDLDTAARAIMTRDGVHIWPLDISPIEFAGYHYRPFDGNAAAGRSYALHTTAGSSSWTLALSDGDSTERFQIKQLNIARLLKGGRFIADRCDQISARDTQAPEHGTRGTIDKVTRSDGALKLALTGPLAGKFVLRPVRLDGRTRFLFCRLGA